MNTEDQYRDAASHALAGFQIIEASLKDYISDFHDIVRGHLPKDMTYEYGRDDIKAAALGRLVSIFARVNNNSALIDKLRKLQSLRDELAHGALTKLYGSEKETYNFDEHIDRLVDLANDLGLLIHDLLFEHVKLCAFRKEKA